MWQKYTPKPTEVASKTFTAIETVADTVTYEFDQQVKPVRKNFAERYPVIFSLLTTVGVVATFLGLEQLLLTAEWLERYPIIILAIGVSLLAFTGTLYKRK